MTDRQSPTRLARDRRRDLIEAARKLFVARGYRDTSVSAIVGEAGVAQGTFYLYFKSKEQVLDALRGEVLRDYMKAFRDGAEPGETADARLVGGLREIYRAVRRNRSLERVFRQAASGEETAQVWLEGKKTMAGPLAQLLREGCDDASFGLDDPKMAAHLTLALFDDLLYEALEYGTPASGRRTLVHGTRFLLRALGAAPARIEQLAPSGTESEHLMPVIESRVDTTSDAFAKNRAEMLALVDGFRDLEAKVRAHSQRAAKKFKERGQLLPRERIARLLDRGAPFLELSTLAGLGLHDDDGDEGATGGGNIIGIGYVKGRRCMVSANDSAIKGGSVTPMGLKKSLRAQQIAHEQKLPAISLTESGGANLLHQSELFVDGGRIFCNLARASAKGYPHICVVHGSSTAGGAYIPGLSDYVVVVRGNAKVFLAGPPLVKAAIGEDATDEELGGAEMHAKVAGTAEYLAEDDAHAVHIARELLGSIQWDDAVGPPRAWDEPRYSPEELCGVVPADPKKPYDCREVIARIVDGSDFLEFKPLYGGGSTVCGHARLEGQEVGIVGNNGPIQPQCSVKAAQFIQLCCQSGIPIIYLQNTTGYMVGKEAEQQGAIKHGSKMIQAVANATVPQITLIVGGSYGAGNYGMCGRSYDPRFIFSWPNAKIAVMGGEQVAMVMKIITRAKFEKKGIPVDEAALEAMSAHLRDQLDRESTALFATARLWDDGIIDPRDSRRVLAFALATCLEAERRQLHSNTFGVARG